MSDSLITDYLETRPYVEIGPKSRIAAARGLNPGAAAWFEPQVQEFFVAWKARRGDMDQHHHLRHPLAVASGEAARPSQEEEDSDADL